MYREIANKALPNETDTACLAQRLAPLLKAGDTLLLEGEIGAGKTFFARSLIHAIIGTADDIPSPTYTLIQTYDGPEFEIWHCDLYRLTSSNDAFELGLDEAFESALSVIEWPDRLGSDTPKNSLKLIFEVTKAGRSISFSGNPSWARRLTHLDE